MRVRVYMRDSHTCYRLQERSQLGQLINGGPADDSKQPVDAEVGHWNPTTGEYAFGPVRLIFLSKGAIGCIEEDAVGVTRAELKMARGVA